MNYQVLARKLRPVVFEELYGHSPIVNAVKNSLLRKHLGHAYLFTGTRGIGKTSMARLFAKALRCENLGTDANPCNKCNCCLDFDSGSSTNVIEIDGASNNSVENVRELVGSVHYFPSFGVYKIIIIDEVHMLTTSAFNALLKTLEEPPNHVKFIFATTEPDKLLGTVISRCQRFDFRPASKKELTNYILNISKKENITFENSLVIEQIADQGRGSYRDTLTIIEQLLNLAQDKKITEDVLVNSLGLARISTLKELLASILIGNLETSVTVFKKITSENFNPKNFLASLATLLFAAIESIDSLDDFFEGKSGKQLVSEDISYAELLWIYEILVKDSEWILKSFDPEKSIDVVLRKLTKRREILFKKDSPKAANSPIAKKEQVENKTWSDFIKHLQQKSPSMATHLMEGNLREPMIFSQDGLHINYGHKKESIVFFEHMKNPDMINKLRDYCAEFFNKTKENIKITMELIPDNSNVVSLAKEAEIKSQQAKNNKKEAFLNDPVVQEFEKMFNKKIEKINVLDGEKND